MHIHWHKYSFTIVESWNFHIDAFECRCGAFKTRVGRGYSSNKKLKTISDAIKYAENYKINDTFRSKTSS